MMLIGSTGLNTIANKVSITGFQVARRFSEQSKSNIGKFDFGNTTKVGTSQFQRNIKKAQKIGSENTARISSESKKTINQFINKLNYTPNATLQAISQSTLDIKV